MLIFKFIATSLVKQGSDSNKDELLRQKNYLGTKNIFLKGLKIKFEKNLGIKNLFNSKNYNVIQSQFFIYDNFVIF